uniref:Uncharacterized protein n=1 Tax=Rhizophora mucronata TaxID=61149 RepID=A0A2P2N7A9_RHIMU
MTIQNKKRIQKLDHRATNIILSDHIQYKYYSDMDQNCTIMVARAKPSKMSDSENVNNSLNVMVRLLYCDLQVIKLSHRNSLLMKTRVKTMYL